MTVVCVCECFGYFGKIQLMHSLQPFPEYKNAWDLNINLLPSVTIGGGKAHFKNCSPNSAIYSTGSTK